MKFNTTKLMFYLLKPLIQILLSQLVKQRLNVKVTHHPSLLYFFAPCSSYQTLTPGDHLTIVAFQRMVGESLLAAEILAKEGFSVEVINLRSIRPLDVETITNSVKKTNRLMSVEEGWPQSGIGSEISALAMERKSFFTTVTFAKDVSKSFNLVI